MNKCEWKDGKFEPCKRFNGKVSTIGYYDYVGEKGVYKFSCDSCGADIQKPEPKVIIKKSGETWVALYDGVDYLAIDPHRFGLVGRMVDIEELEEKGIVKPISEIEITDDIAKLRPIVVVCGDNYTLFAIDVKNGSAWISNNPDENASVHYVSDIRLATVSDLED